MIIRKTLIDGMKKDKEYSNILAFYIYVKSLGGERGHIRGASISRLARLTGDSRKTTKKYLTECIKAGFMWFEGGKKKILRFASYKSHSKYKNVEVDDRCIDTTSFQKTKESVRGLALLRVVKRKVDVCSMACTLENPRNLKEYREVKSNVRYVDGFDPYDPSYKEFGISYKTIGELSGTCVKTAQKTVKFLVEKGAIIYQAVREWLFCPGINHRNPAECGLEGYTFTTDNFACRQGANVYSIPSSSYCSLYIHGNI